MISKYFSFSLLISKLGMIIFFKFNNASSTIVILEEDNQDYIYIMMPMSV